MAKARTKPTRRDDALSRERIVAAAIELLDVEGADGLTFRDLAAHLATGAGAIYWHVANKRELLAAASEAVIADVLGALPATTSARKATRDLASGVYEAIDAHPWLGAELSHGPWGTATLRIFERIGRQLQALDVPARAQFTAASALVSYVIGAGSQNAANRRSVPPGMDRAMVLATEAARWDALDAAEWPFMHQLAGRLRKHDDTAEFLAGIDLILAGAQ